MSLILSKDEIVPRIDDIAEKLCSRAELANMTPEEAGAFKMGVQSLRSELLAIISDFI